jgi:hypothetical protein
MHTGENEQALRKIIDMTRLMSMAILVLHFYYYCYASFDQWHLTSPLLDRLLENISNTGLFKSFHQTKFFSLGLLIISLIGAKGKMNEKLNFKAVFAYIITGLVVYFFSYLFLLTNFTISTITILYIGITVTRYLLVLSGGMFKNLICDFYKARFMAYTVQYSQLLLLYCLKSRWVRVFFSLYLHFQCSRDRAYVVEIDGPYWKFQCKV